MDERFNESERPVNPRRRQRTQMQIIKEDYLPVIIAGAALIMVVIFIIGSITRGVQKNRAEKEALLAESAASAAAQEKLEQEANDLIAQSKKLAANYDYPAAIALLDSFSGDISKFPLLNDKILEYERAQKAMIPWEDPSQIMNLSFQLLVADPSRSFTHSTYGYLMNKNFITTDEFSSILQQLYDNGYILVDMDDFVSVEDGVDGAKIYKAKTLYLPNGKKPIMLTQTNVNYNYYLIDSDNDKKADAKGTGIASKLLWDGVNFTCEMVDASGNTVTGDYDMVPILEKFVEKHPDFSYRGAKATLALTGYNGLFGYRTHPSAASTFGDAAYQQDIKDAKAVADALKKKGYTLACYTYENVPYGEMDVTKIKNDLNNWNNEVVSILGNIDVLAYAQMTDISNDPTYSGDKFRALYDNGFRYYLGFSTDGKPWTTITNGYVRQGRIMVTGSNLAHHADWFANLFDASVVLDPTRGNVPG